MTNSVPETFNVPPGFSVEEINGQLYHEDLEDDDELWLIRMPCDTELSVLDRKKIFLSNNAGDTSVKNFETENGKLLECYAETCEISSTCVVLPKRQDGQLHAVNKTIKGAILISEGLSLNNEVEIKFEKKDDHLDNTSSHIVESNYEKASKRKKKSHTDLNISDLKPKHEECEPNFQNANKSTAKKKKSTKTKRHSQVDFDSSDLNYETEAAESFDSPISQKKLSKKRSSSHRKSSESLEIKDEPMPMDLDGFPTCSSQK